jgi:hypothetical protein
VDSSHEEKGEVAVERRHFVSSLPADGLRYALHETWRDFLVFITADEDLE